MTARRLQPLVQFLYILGRDELPLGAIEAIIARHVELHPGKDVKYSNPHLEAWAREAAERIVITRTRP